MAKDEMAYTSTTIYAEADASTTHFLRSALTHQRTLRIIIHQNHQLVYDDE